MTISLPKIVGFSLVQTQMERTLGMYMRWTSLSHWWRKLENLLEGCIVSNSNQHKVVKTYHYLASKDRHEKWAIPGTEKKQIATDANEPMSTVPSWLKSASHANSSQPSDTKSAQSFCANSSQPPHINGSPIATGTDDNHPKTPQVDTVDVKHPKTSQSDNNDNEMTFKSPASNATHNPVFDNGNASSPAEDWELDMTLLPSRDQQASVRVWALKSIQHDLE